MRITGGTLCGRTLRAPTGMNTRPTTDRVREALFNTLAHRDWGEAIGKPLEKTLVLDAFCGTGALAFEALSYGATSAFLFDKDREAITVARDNAEKIGLVHKCSLMNIDATRPPKAKMACNLVFLDPPYNQGLVPLALTALDAKGWIEEDALIVVETAKKEELVLPENIKQFLTRAYGDTTIHFMVKTGS